MGVVVEEAEESVFWLELLCESNIVPEVRLFGALKRSERTHSHFH
jgi:hypothetical protein